VYSFAKQKGLDALITLGFLRELRMRDPAVTVRDLARSTGVSRRRLAELEQCRGKPVTSKESVAIAASLYGRVLRATRREGVCRVCGCTDEYGCDVGCGWVNSTHTLCSECVEDQSARGR
jgi:hypothetical protein